MPLPRQVQAQLEHAEALLAAQHAPQPQPEPPAPIETPPPPPAPAPVEAPATPLAPVPAAPAPSVPEATWEQRYRSLQGQHRGMQDRIQSMEAKISQLTSQAPAPTPPAPTPAPRPAADPKDVNAFGLDMVEMVQRTCEGFLGSASQQIDRRFSALEQLVNNLVQQVQGTHQSVARTAEQVFFDKLAAAVPNWQEINEHDGFLAFLAAPDPIYGRPRQMALDEAQNTGDAQRAAAIFKAFLDTMPKPPAAPPTGSPTPRSAGSPPPPPPPPGKRTYTQAQVAKFYDEVRRGHYRGNPQEAVRLEVEFDAAMAEGRIV